MLPLFCKAILNYVRSHFCILYSSQCLEKPQILPWWFARVFWLLSGKIVWFSLCSGNLIYIYIYNIYMYIYYIYPYIVICKQANWLILLLFCIYFYSNVAFVYWRLRINNRNLQCDLLSLKDTIITFPLILPMEYLCKITFSNYIACLKPTLKNNRPSGRGHPALLQKLKRKHV